VSPVKYELGFYIPEDDILHNHRRENLKSYLLQIRTTLVVTYSTVFALLMADGHMEVSRIFSFVKTFK
jgi:hypothetical protein